MKLFTSAAEMKGQWWRRCDGSALSKDDFLELGALVGGEEEGRMKVEKGMY